MSQINNTLIPESTERAVERLLYAVGFKNKLLGFIYLRDAITMCCVEDRKYYLSTEVYPKIASKRHSNSIRVERAIRNVIRDCYNSGQLKRLNDIFKNIILDDKYCPTNAELILAISSRLFRLISADKADDICVQFDNLG